MIASLAGCERTMSHHAGSGNRTEMTEPGATDRAADGAAPLNVSGWSDDSTASTNENVVCPAMSATRGCQSSVLTSGTGARSSS